MGLWAVVFYKNQVQFSLLHFSFCSGSSCSRFHLFSLSRSLARSLLVASSFFFVHTLLPSCRAVETATASADPTAAADLTAGESAISVLWISFVWFPGFANSMLSFFFRFRGLATSMLSFSLWAHCFDFQDFLIPRFRFLCELISFVFQVLLIPRFLSFVRRFLSISRIC